MVPVLTFTVILNIPKFFESKFIWENDPNAGSSTSNNSSSSSSSSGGNVTFVTLGVSDLRSDPDYIRFYINWTRLLTTGKSKEEVMY